MATKNPLISTALPILVLTLSAFPMPGSAAETEPPVVTPGVNGTPPSDAIVLFDGKDLSKWKSAKGPAGWKVEPRADEIGPAGDNPVSSCFYEDRDANSGGSYASVALAPKPCDGNASRTRASIRRRLRAADVPSRRLSAAGMRDGEAFSIAEAIPDLNFGPLTEAFFEAGAYCVTVQIPNTVADPNALLDRVERAAVTVAGRL